MESIGEPRNSLRGDKIGLVTPFFVSSLNPNVTQDIQQLQNYGLEPLVAQKLIILCKTLKIAGKNLSVKMYYNYKNCIQLVKILYLIKNKKGVHRTSILARENLPKSLRSKCKYFIIQKDLTTEHVRVLLNSKCSGLFQTFF